MFIVHCSLLPVRGAVAALLAANSSRARVDIVASVFVYRVRALCPLNLYKQKTAKKQHSSVFSKLVFIEYVWTW